MKTLKELRAERAQAAEKGRVKAAELNALAKIDEPTAEQTAQAETLNAEIDGLEADVARIDKDIKAREDAERRAGVFSAPAAVSARESARTVGEPGPGMRGFRSAAEFALAVRTASMGGIPDRRLIGEMDGPARGAAPTNFHQNNGAEGEGFLVPPDISQRIWNLVFEETDFPALCDNVKTSSNSVTIPKDETTPWGTAGVQAAWAAESAQMTASKMQLNPETVRLNELRAFLIATAEIMDDAPRLENAMTVQAARAIRWKLSDAIINGDGNGKPLGFLNSPALVKVAKDSGQASGTVSVTNCLNVASRISRYGAGRPFWVAQPDVMPQLASMTIGNVPAFLPFNQPLAESPWEGTLLGRPVLFTEHAQALGAPGDLTLVNLSGGYMFLTREGGGIDMAQSIHLFFDYNMNAFRWIFRAGGQPYLSAAYTPPNSSNTRSHFVTIVQR
jgi:HK97 family phage major capsid protein